MRITYAVANVFIVSLFAASHAYAGTDVEIELELDAMGKPVKNQCKRREAATARADDELVIKVPAGKVLTVDVSVSAGKVTGQKLKAREDKLTFPAGAYAKETVVVGDAAAPYCTVEAQTPTQSTSSTLSSASRSVFTDGAMLKLEDAKIYDHRVTGGSLGRVYKLYHLPDGTLAFPLPSHISEEDEIEIWVVLPEGGAAQLEVVACDEVPLYRVDGSYKDALGRAGTLEDGRDIEHYLLKPLGRRLHCAGTLTYKLDVKGSGFSDGLVGSTTTSITIDPIYRFEWGVGYMFDFARPVKLSLGDRPSTTEEDGTEKFVIETNEYTGARPIVTLAVDVCGANPRQLDWCDRLINPTVWIDPQRADDGFGVGLGFRPFYGLSVLVGISVFPSMEVADGSSFKGGDAWTAAGELPTKTVFNRDGLGFALAATVSTDLFAKLFP